MAAGLRSVAAGELKRWLEQGGTTLIDVRGADEHARERLGHGRELGARNAG